MVNNPTAMQVTPVDPRVWKIPWRREWLPIHYSCLENSRAESQAAGPTADEGSVQVSCAPPIRGRHLASLCLVPGVGGLPAWLRWCVPDFFMIKACFTVVTSSSFGERLFETLWNPDARLLHLVLLAPLLSPCWRQSGGFLSPVSSQLSAFSGRLTPHSSIILASE